MARPLRQDEFTIDLRVEFEDVDLYRVVHHARMVLYIERARVRFFDHLGIDLNRRDVDMVLYELSMQYKKPARFLEELTVSVAVEATDALRLTLAHRIRRGNELIAKAKTVLAFVDPETKGIVTVPEDFAEAVAKA